MKTKDKKGISKLQGCKVKEGGTIKQWQETGRLKQ